MKAILLVSPSKNKQNKFLVSAFTPSQMNNFSFKKHDEVEMSMSSYDQQIEEQILKNSNGLIESTFENLKVVTLDNKNKPLKKEGKKKQKVD